MKFRFLVDADLLHGTAQLHDTYMMQAASVSTRQLDNKTALPMIHEGSPMITQPLRIRGGTAQGMAM